MALTKVSRGLLSTSIVDNGNATAITIDASENVGIGTSSPDVFSRGYTGTITGISSASGETALMLNSSGTNVTALEMGRAGTRELLLYDTPTASQLFSLTSKPLAFGTAGAERMRILSTGGITFNGDTAQANALDDYEEGTWTLGLNTSNSDATISSVNTTGYYTKIGNLVTVNIYNAGANITAVGTGTAQISGLPFTVANGHGYYSTVTFGHTNMFTTQVEAYAAINTKFCVVTQAGTITSAVFAAGTPRYMMMSLTYMTND